MHTNEFNKKDLFHDFHVQLEYIMKDILNYLGYHNILVESEIKNIKHSHNYVPDMIAEKGNCKYIIEVKFSRDIPFNFLTNICSKNILNNDNRLILLLPFITDDSYKKCLNKYNYLDIWSAYDILNKIEQIDEVSVKQNLMQKISIFYKKADIPLDIVKCNKEYTNEIDISDDLLFFLENVENGRSSAYKYEEFAQKFLNYVFKEDIVEITAHNKTATGVNVFDAIARLSSLTADSFWDIVKSHYNTRYIIFECKNYSHKITQREVFMTTKYLCNSALRNVAIMFTRKGIDTGAQKIIRQILRETGKLILVLDDTDIKRMIKDKESRDLILLEHLDELLMHTDG